MLFLCCCSNAAAFRVCPSSPLPAFVSPLLTTFHLKHLILVHFSGFVSPVSSPTILLVSGSIKLFIWVSLSQIDSAIDSMFTGVCFVYLGLPIFSGGLYFSSRPLID